MSMILCLVSALLLNMRASPVAKHELLLDDDPDETEMTVLRTVDVLMPNTPDASDQPDSKLAKKD